MVHIVAVAPNNNKNILDKKEENNRVSNIPRDTCVDTEVHWSSTCAA